MLKSINKVIRFLIYGNFVLNAAWGFVAPVFAIFIVERIAAGDPAKGAEIVGFAVLIYWVTKSILQIPLSQSFDRRTGERDDYWFMIFGLFIVSLSPIGFLISKTMWHIFLFEAVHAIGMAMFFPPWNGIFSRHIDRGKEASEWGLDSSFLGFGFGITGAIGGLLVAFWGFKIIFILASIMSFGAAILLLLIHKDILPRDKILPRGFPFIIRFPL